MLIENSFQVAAAPDRVFEFLRDAHNVVGCLPGAELVADLGNDSYRGKVKIKVGPVTAAYTGIATITRIDPADRVAVLLAEGRDSRGNGAAKATATMRVSPDGAGSTVDLSTDLSVTGKIAQFGRSVLSDVSTRMVGELATRVRDRIEAADAPTGGTPAGGAPADQAPMGGTAAGQAPAGGTPVGGTPAGGTAMNSGAADEDAAAAAPVPSPRRPDDDAIKASSLVWPVLAGVFRRLFARLRRRPAARKETP